MEFNLLNQSHLHSNPFFSVPGNKKEKLSEKNKNKLSAPIPLPDISNTERRKIASITNKRKFSKGTFVFKQNTPGDQLFLLHKGLVVITRTIREDQAQIISAHKNGDFFGETTFIEGKEHPASAFCTADSMISIISKKDFDKLAQEDPVLGIKILKQISHLLCSKLRSVDDKVKRMGEYACRK